MIEAFLNKVKESLEGITALFSGFTSVFAAFMQLAAEKNEEDESESDEPVVAKRR